MAALGEFFRSSRGRVVGGAALGVVVVLAVLWMWGAFSGSEAARTSQRPVFMCTETGKSFECTLQAGDKVPVKSPYSGRNTGYPAEKCFWNRDGTLKKEPTYVLLNMHRGQPEPTYCPDCGFRVVEKNPSPIPGDKPPPRQGQEQGSGRRERD